MQLIIRYLSFLFLLLGVNASIAQTIPARPNPPRLVNDFANVLSPEEERALEQKLVQFDDSTSTQVAVITVTTLDGYGVEEVAHKFLRDWGVGKKGKNNGVVILAAIQDRKINIQTGLGMEGALPDLVCKRIISTHIIPAFKQQRYFDGLDNATTNIIKISKNEYTNDEHQGGGDGTELIIIFFFIVICMIIVFATIRRKSRGTVMTRRGYTNWDGGGWWYLPGGGGGSSWDDDDRRGGGGGSDWDFGGFGGGDGGGGGASGDW
jgi:uncharacterized protein